MEPGLPIPVVITAFADKSFTSSSRPPATIPIKKAAGIQKGSAKPHTDKVRKITRAQVEEIAKTKHARPDRCRPRRRRAHHRRLARSWASPWRACNHGEAVQASSGLRKVDATRLYPVDALRLVKECATAKFDESIDIAVNLASMPRKSDQVVRGSVVLPAAPARPSSRRRVRPGRQGRGRPAAGAEVVGMTTSPSRSRPAILISTSCIATLTPCAWSASSARSSVRAA